MNVAEQLVDPASLFGCYRRLLGVRRRMAPLRQGDCVLLGLDPGANALQTLFSTRRAHHVERPSALTVGPR